MKRSFLSIALVTSLVFFCLLQTTIPRAAGAADAVSPPAGLVGWWPGDGFALDISGKGNNGTLQNGATYAPGKVGQAFSFDGVDDYVSVPDSSQLSPHIGASGEMTVIAWVQISAYPSRDRPFVAKGAANNWEYALYVNANGSVQFNLWNLAGSVYYANPSGGQLNLGQWHHVAGVLKKGQFARIYLDGVLVGEQTSFTQDTDDGTSLFHIGCRGDGYYFPGSVDEVALFNRALAVEEVSAMYAAGSAGMAFRTDSAPIILQQPVSETHYPGESTDL